MIYIPEWSPPDLQCDDGSYLGAWTLAGDNLYYSYNITTREGQNETFIGGIDLLTGEKSTLQKRGDGNIHSLFTDSGQNLRCLRIVPKGTEDADRLCGGQGPGSLSGNGKRKKPETIL